MKRTISILVACLIILVIFAGCQKAATTPTSDESVSDSKPNQESTEVKESPEEPAKKLTVVVSMRSMNSEYHMQYVAGAQLFVDSLPPGTAEVVALPCEANDDKQINDLKAQIASTGKDTILFIDANNAPNINAVADICEEAGIYWVDAWNVPEGMSPMDYEYWVHHQSCDGVKQGYDIAVEMFKNFDTPGEGKILAIQGMLANNAAIDRDTGLAQALDEYPGIELLDQQPADWDTKKALALTETWLAKYPDIDGIWCACDDMALGVVQALKAKGLNGKVKVTGVDGTSDAIAMVESGDIVCTIANNGFMQAGYGVAYAYNAYIGNIDPKTMPAEKRLFYTDGYLVSNDTLQDYKDNFVTNKPQYDFNDLDFIIARPME